MVDWKGINMQSMYKEYSPSTTVQYEQYMYTLQWNKEWKDRRTKNVTTTLKINNK